MILEPGHGHGLQAYQAATQLVDGAVGPGQFVVYGLPLPGHEEAPDLEERQGQFGQFRHVRNRACRDGLPVTTMAGIARQGLRPSRGDGHAITEPGRLHGSCQEAGLLADRLNEESPPRGKGYGEWKSREAATTADVEELLHAGTSQKRQCGQAVDDLVPGDHLRGADSAQVDGLVPGHEQADVVTDGLQLSLGQARSGARFRVQPRVDGVEAGFDRG